MDKPIDPAPTSEDYSTACRVLRHIQEQGPDSLMRAFALRMDTRVRALKEALSSFEASTDRVSAQRDYLLQGCTNLDLRCVQIRTQLLPDAPSHPRHGVESARTRLRTAQAYTSGLQLDLIELLALEIPLSRSVYDCNIKAAIAAAHVHRALIRLVPKSTPGRIKDAMPEALFNVAGAAPFIGVAISLGAAIREIARAAENPTVATSSLQNTYATLQCLDSERVLDDIFISATEYIKEATTVTQESLAVLSGEVLSAIKNHVDIVDEAEAIIQGAHIEGKDEHRRMQATFARLERHLGPGHEEVET